MASLYPAAIERSPTILLYENSSPGAKIVPSIFDAAIFKLLLLSLLLSSNLVEKVDSWLGKTLIFKFFNFTFGSVYFNCILNSELLLYSSKNFFFFF